MQPLQFLLNQLNGVITKKNIRPKLRSQLYVMLLQCLVDDGKLFHISFLLL